MTITRGKSLRPRAVLLAAVMAGVTIMGMGVAGAARSASVATPKFSGTINLGFEESLTGASAATGASQVHGALVAIQDINNSGGVVINGKHYQFNPDVCNDNSQITEVAACADHLVLDDHDKFIFGGFADNGPIVWGVTEPNHVIYFSTGSAVAALANKSHYTVQADPPLYDREVDSVRSLLKYDPTVKTVALMGDQDITTLDAFAQLRVALKAFHIKVVGSQIAPADLTSFSSLMTVLKNGNPDVLWTYMSSTARLETVLTENGQLRVAQVVQNNSGTCSPLYPSTPGITYLAQTNTGAIAFGPLESAKVKKYQQQYYALSSNVSGPVPNPDPNINGALFTFDDFGLLRVAIEAAGTATNITKVLKELNTVTYTGINGTIKLHDNASSLGQVECVAFNGNGNGNGISQEVEAYPNGTTSAWSK